MRYKHRINYDYFRNIRLLFNLKRFIPDHFIAELSDLPLILGHEIKGIIFDIDQTIISYNKDVVDKTVISQIEPLCQRFQCCLLSNYRKSESQTARVNKISMQIGIPIVQTTNKKPSPRAYEAALRFLNLRADEVTMVGDRIITDIVGAKYMSIKAVYKKPLDVWGDPFLLVTIPRILETSVLKLIRIFIN